MERELALRLDDGTIVRDREWRCMADVMRGFHGFGNRQVYGVIVYADTLQIYPVQLADPDTGPRTNPLLG